MMRMIQILCLSGTVLLVGCDEADSPFRSESIKTTTIEGKVRSSRNGGEEVRVWRDPDTGCQYFLWERRRAGSMTPRLTPDGRPMCGPASQGK